MVNSISNIIIIPAFRCSLWVVSQIFQHRKAIWLYFPHLLISIVHDEYIFILFFIYFIAQSTSEYYVQNYAVMECFTFKYIFFCNYSHFLEAWNLFFLLNCLLILYFQKQTRRNNTFVSIQLWMCACVHGFSHTHISNNTSIYLLHFLELL